MSDDNSSKLNIIISHKEGKKASSGLNSLIFDPKIQQSLQELIDELIKPISDLVEESLMPGVRENITRLLETLEPVYEKRFAPGTLLGDFIIVYGGEEQQEEALERLATGYFCRTAVIYGERWISIRELYNERNGYYPTVEYIDLAKPAIVMAIHREELLDETANNFYSEIRLWVRKFIEIELLDGETLDQAQGRKVRLIRIPVDDTPEADAFEKKYANDISFNPQIRIDSLLIQYHFLEKLSKEQQIAIIAKECGYSDDEIAEALGKTTVDVRQYRSRGKKKMTERFTQEEIILDKLFEEEN
jgi:hypothetical protein